MTLKGNNGGLGDLMEDLVSTQIAISFTYMAEMASDFAKVGSRLAEGLGLLQPVLDRDDCCLGTVRDAKFRQNSADMIPHRPIG